MAELQTVTAALNITRLACQTCIFLRDVHNADVLASRLYKNTQRIHRLAQDVATALRRKAAQRRAHRPLPGEARIALNIKASLDTIEQILLKIERKFKGLNPNLESSASGRTYSRILLILKHPAIERHESELEIQIQALHTSLGALQL